MLLALPSSKTVSVEVAGIDGLSASWKKGTRPALENEGPGNGTWTAWRGWLGLGTSVQASAQTNPIPPWLGPTPGWASCTIYTTFSPATDKLGNDAWGHRQRELLPGLQD